jgi:prevent-host-death family protein
MAIKANVYEAKTHFSKLLARMSEGEEVIITRAGKPVARLAPIVKKRAKRVAGTAKGKIIIQKNFDEPLPENIQREFTK